MKKLFIFALLIFGGYLMWGKNQSTEFVPIYDEPYVAVYGKDSCGYITRMLSDLEEKGMGYQYWRTSDTEVNQSIVNRMRESGIRIGRSYQLPVLDVNGVITIRPAIDAVVRQYQNK